MDELKILIWTFVIISVIEFIEIIILGNIINYYQEVAEKNWHLYLKESKINQFLKEKISEQYENKINKIMEKLKL